MVFEELNGKVALITGSSSGIGASTAVLFAKYGTAVTITGRNADALAKVKAQCEAAGLGSDKILTLIGDVTDDKHLEDLVMKTVEKFGRLDYLVNNAGAAKYSVITETPLDEYTFTFDVNVRSLIKLIQLATPQLVKSKGAIVNVSSVIARRGVPGSGYYCMSKAAVDMMTKCVAMELAPKGVRVNSVNPGVIDTKIYTAQMNMSPEAKMEFFEKFSKTTPLLRPGNPDEIASSIVFMASNSSSYTTGTSLVVDGGIEQVMTI